MSRDLSDHAEAVIAYVHETGGGVTFPEIADLLERRGVPTKGEHAAEVPDCPNLFLWAGMSQEFFDITAAAKASGRVVTVPMSRLALLTTGTLLTFPIASRAPKSGYREPHWVPVCFNPVRKAVRS